MFSVKIKGTIQAIGSDILVCDMENGNKKTKSGLTILDDNMKDRGIRPRWAKVYAVGPKRDNVAVGEWILLKHGRWTNRVKIENEESEVYIQKADPEGILAISDVEPDVVEYYKKSS